MKPERFKRTRTVVATSALALVVAAATFGIASVVVGTRNSAQHLGFDLTSGPCSTVSVSPPTFAVCGPAPGAGPVLYPGVDPSTVPLTFYNALSVGIDVTSLSVSFAGTSFPNKCTPSDFHFAGTAISGVAPSLSGTSPDVTLTFAPGHYVHVPGGGSVATPKTTVYDATLALTDHGDQTTCHDLPITMSYTASARFTEVYNTSTVVTSNHNPAVIGQAITYTATVTANPTTGQDPVSSSPTGTVTFMDNGTNISGCVGLAVTSTGTTTSTAACPFSYASTAGSPHPITAVYSNTAVIPANTDGNFNGSTSGALSQVVNPTPTTLTLTSTPSGSVFFGQNFTLNATINPASGPTGTVSFYLGTPSGSHELLGSSSLSGGVAFLTLQAQLPGANSIYAVYGGSTIYASSTSNVITLTVGFNKCISGTVNGGYTVLAGQSICITGRVNGGLTVQATGSLFLNGATINGGTTSSTGATELRFCGSTINGNVNITRTTGFVLIGDGGDADDLPPTCAGNSINAVSTSIANNTGGVEFGGNTVIGLVSITNNINAIGPEVEANKITGTLTCSGNLAVPTADSHKNTVIGVKLLQCAGSSF